MNKSIDKIECGLLILLCSKKLSKREVIYLSYDYSKLRGRIIECYGKQQLFAAAMGWSQRTCSLKLSNQVFWKQPEITRATKLLKIKNEEIQKYFFTQKVQ